MASTAEGRVFGGELYVLRPRRLLTAETLLSGILMLAGYCLYALSSVLLLLDGLMSGGWLMIDFVCRVRVELNVSFHPKRLLPLIAEFQLN